MNIIEFFYRWREKHKTSGIPKQIKQLSEKPIIGLVVTTFDKGGLEQVVLNLYSGYKSKGYKVYMMCQENVLGVMAMQIEPDEMLVFDSKLDTFLDYLYDKNINVLHYHYNVFACREAKARGVHIMYTMHNVYTWKSDSEIKEYSKLLSEMGKLVPVSNFVKNYYLARTFTKQDNIKVIYNGIDFKELSCDMLPEYIGRSALGLQADDVVLGFVASFYPVKYQIGMIGVMEELIKQYPKTKLLFIGNSENDYYKEFVREYNMSTAKENMQVVPYFEHKYMGAFLRKIIDIFTLPTLQEGCSNAVLEAVFCDKPLVLTNVGNAMDINHLKSCEVVHTAYDDVIKTSNEQMVRLSLFKDSGNKRELVEAFKKVINQLEKYKKAAILPEEEKKQYETAYMIEQYVNIIEEVTRQ